MKSVYTITRDAASVLVGITISVIPTLTYAATNAQITGSAAAGYGVATPSAVGTGSDVNASVHANVNASSTIEGSVEEGGSMNADGTVRSTESASTKAKLEVTAQLSAADKNVSKAVVSEDHIALRYSTHAKLFGIFSVIVPVTAEVKSNNDVTLKYPWYGMFLTTDTAALHAKIQAAARSTLSPQTASSETGVSASATLSTGEQMALLESVRAAMKTDFDAYASAE